MSDLLGDERPWNDILPERLDALNAIDGARYEIDGPCGCDDLHGEMAGALVRAAMTIERLRDLAGLTGDALISTKEHNVPLFEEAAR